MDCQETISTTASIEHCWAALEDVTSYPRWTTSMSAVEPLDGPALRTGHRFRIRQPGLPATVWRVCELNPGTSFAWDAHAPGVHTLAHHRLDRQPDGTTRIRIGIRQTGALAWLVALLIGPRTRRYLRMEAAGLRAAAEAVAADGSAATDDGTASTGGR
ncbi:SRPBCC family protein [Micromonospora narathiwatensis]|uniref:Polyketide cyclase / dehydrase and lipid transport n=1 Tax=Micromonospora narathiwatensis TaxID=299146 RepID=A0A1A8ZKG3_9ACTN|nr:SRPBCC family protein [Micromonospora narathiwatensis]SBT44350.1 Polyketide cyclase / dehydrase and lipid transport [Micromonospora narathiwatensis]